MSFGYGTNFVILTFF